MIAVGYIVMCLVFGTTFLAIKIGVEAGLPPFLSAGLRFLVAGILMYTWMKLRGKAQWSLLLRKEMLLTGLGLTFGTFAALYWAEQYVSSGIGAILSATGPLM
ncbi:EamA family transporter, partial [Paenibacillus massiliensis]